MSALNSEQIISTLRDGGSVAQKLPSYEPRQAQLDLLELIIRGFNEDAHVMAEAGTGVGKSFAYLLPAMHFALAKKEKVVISTATITLQQQLFEKDIPLVAESMGDVKIKSVIMKGRGNYVCLRRLDDALHEQSLFDFDKDELKRIGEWAETTKTGGRAEIEFMPTEAVWASVCSESDLCLGNHCLFREKCFILSLRKEANNAHIIVVNHHLLFADLAARFQGAGYESAVILPPFNRLIIDEAHTIENAATSFFSSEFSRTGIFRQIGRLYHKRRANIRGLLIKLCAMIPSGSDPLDSMADAVQKIRTSSEELDDCALQLCGAEGIFRLSPSVDESFLKKSLFPHLKSLRKDILNLTNIVRDITENMDEEKAADPIVWEVKSIIRHLEGTAEICDAFCKYKKHEDEVLWIEKLRLSKDPWAVFTRTPLDLAPRLKESVFSPNKTVVCLSATLAINDDFSYWAGRCGISSLEKRIVLSGCFPSPFPYSSAVLLASPTDAPLPDETAYQGFVDKAASRLTAIAGGGALVLFTSYQALTSAHLAAKSELEPLGIRCLKQGDDDRTRLLNTFLNDESSCLFATDSFWEGVDAPGDTLRLVIICRLPFRTPSDPVHEARRELLEKEGKNPFMEISLPQAVMKFKQGFGRLMRRSADRGVVVVLDSRLLKKNYGQVFLQALPETKTSFSPLDNILEHIENFLY
ncbi:MAG: DEAD/DEAH box helicase family protein [Treponema sp.]|jgi:ATP-dependent DNA helicase DinG|nr:DEAD/DEAH box helicase family protein [Treponema sp.]